jgi:hypothetical protein
MSVLSSLLDIAITLAAIYVSISCLCSAINEQIASFLKLRGAKLYQGVLNLLVGEKPLVDGIFQHPMIAAASDDKTGAIDVKKAYRPSYLDARNFSMAFWQTIRVQKPLPAEQVAATAISTPTQLLNDIAQRIDALPAGKLKDSLEPLINAASGDYESLLKATDSWFNAQMDRVSGWYKRQTQFNLAIIAAIIVLASGIDSIEVGNKLYFDQALREKVVESIVRSLPPQKASKESPPGAIISPDMAVAKNIDAQLQADLGIFCHPPTDWIKNIWHIPGMLVTFLALLLGGPFWFDALAKLVNVRSAGRKPQRADQPPE